MGYYEDQLKAYENRLRGLTSPGSSAQDVVNVRSRLGDVASQFGSGARDLVSGAGADVIEKTGQRIGRRADELGDTFELKRNQTRLNQLYNVLLQKYLDDGNSLQASDAAARQLASDQISMERQSQQAEASRESRQRKVDVAAEYQTAMDNLQPDLGNPYEQALMRSLFGLGTAGLTYKLLTPRKSKTPTPANYEGTYAGQLQGAFNRENVRPYTLDYGTRGRVKYP